MTSEAGDGAGGVLRVANDRAVSAVEKKPDVVPRVGQLGDLLLYEEHDSHGSLPQ